MHFEHSNPPKTQQHLHQPADESSPARQSTQPPPWCPCRSRFSRKQGWASLNGDWGGGGPVLRYDPANHRVMRASLARRGSLSASPTTTWPTRAPAPSALAPDGTWTPPKGGSRSLHRALSAPPRCGRGKPEKLAVTILGGKQRVPPSRSAGCLALAFVGPGHVLAGGFLPTARPQGCPADAGSHCEVH